MKGVADKQAADASADAQRRNAKLSESAASDALERGETNAGRIATAGSIVGGAQKAEFAGGNVDASSGSAARTQEDTAERTALDEQIARNNAQREAWGLDKQAENQKADADRTESAGNFAMFNDIIGGATNAATSYIGGGGK